MLAGCTKGLLKIKSIKAKCQKVLQVCTTKCYNKNNKCALYMALCNTVHYSYGKYMKDKVRHYKLWQNMLDNQEISQ